MAHQPPANATELLERYATGERRFTNVNLSGASLFGANLSGAYLGAANLRGADLRDAKLGGANLSGADLRDASLTRADLVDANLRGADLTSADLNGAYLSGAYLIRANLTRADLGIASLSDANLSRADLSGAYLSGAGLTGANLSGANLSGANLSGAELGYTQLGRVSLIPFCQADPSVVHEGPSSIDFESITLSLLAPNLETFLIRAGIPAIAAQYMIDTAKAVKGSVSNMMQSVFISYGTPDEPFARKLYEALYKNGVRTFFFPEHAEPGENISRMMREGVHNHDHVILICSESSLGRPGVLNEIEATLAREARDGGKAYLIPIRLDDYVLTGWKPARTDIAQAIRNRVIADFSGVMENPRKFDVSIRRLVAALRS